MEKKLKNKIIEQLDFLKKVYEQASRDVNAKEKARKHASKELEKIMNILEELKSE